MTQAAPWWAKYEQGGAPDGVRVLSFAGPAAAAAAADDAPAVEAAVARERAARPQAAAAAQRALYQHVDVPTFALNDGTRIPAIGLGTWKAAPGEVRLLAARPLNRAAASVPGLLLKRCLCVRAAGAGGCGGGAQGRLPPHRLRGSVPERGGGEHLRDGVGGSAGRRGGMRDSPAPAALAPARASPLPPRYARMSSNAGFLPAPRIAGGGCAARGAGGRAGAPPGALHLLQSVEQRPQRGARAPGLPQVAQGTGRGACAGLAGAGRGRQLPQPCPPR